MYDPKNTHSLHARMSIPSSRHGGTFCILESSICHTSFSASKSIS